MCVFTKLYLPSCNIQEKSYAHTVPSPILLSSLLLKSSIFLALITSASSLFQASIWEAVFFYVSLACSAFQLLLVSSCCSVVPHKQIISINFFQTYVCVCVYSFNLLL